jgi:hypothetical protein
LHLKMGWGSNGTANRLRANLNKRQKSSIGFYAEKWANYHIAAKSDICANQSHPRKRKKSYAKP